MIGKRRWSLGLLSLLVLLLLPLTALAASSPQDTDLYSPQIMVVMDISGSMAQHVVPDVSELPEDMAEMYTQLREMEQAEDVATLETKARDIEKAPEVLAANDALDATQQRFDEFLRDRGYKGLHSIVSDLRLPLATGACDTTTVYELVTQLTLEEVDAYLTQICYLAPTPELLDQVHDQVGYMSEPGYAEVVTDYVTAIQAHEDLLESLGYYDALYQRETLLESRGYYALYDQFETRAGELGYPTRLELARVAANSLIDLSQLDNLATGRRTRLGLVGFSDDPYLMTTFTDQFDALTQIVDALQPVNMTNISGGLEIALVEFENQADPDQPSLIILLSDGHANVGMTPTQMLEQLAPRAEERDIRICTAGFGTEESEVDVELLQGLADRTGGEFVFARTGEELMSFFVGCRQGLVGDILSQLTGQVASGDLSEPQTVAIPENTGEMSVTLNFLEGDLELVLMGPDGNPVDKGDPNYSSEKESNVQLVTVTDPAPGDWTIKVQSLAAPEKGSIFNVLISITERQVPTPTPAPPTPIPTADPTEMLPGFVPFAVGGCICLTVLALVGGAVVIVLRRRGSSGSAPPAGPAEPPPSAPPPPPPDSPSIEQTLYAGDDAPRSVDPSIAQTIVHKSRDKGDDSG